MASVHDGHRARMRDKIRKGGLGSFQQHEILEYLLFSLCRGRIPTKSHTHL